MTTIKNDGCRADKRKSRGLPGDDGPCQHCGQPYPAWRAPNDLWNLVMGGPNATSDPGGMLCPICFLRLADERAPMRGAWVIGTPVRPESVVATEALNAAAHDLRTNAARAWGGTYGWYTTGRHVAGLAADWITNIADGRTR